MIWEYRFKFANNAVEFWLNPMSSTRHCDFVLHVLKDWHWNDALKAQSKLDWQLWYAKSNQNSIQASQQTVTNVLTDHKCNMICCCRDHGSFSSASTFHCGDRGSRRWDGWGGWGFWSWGMWRLRGRFESWGGWAHRHGAWGWRWGRGYSCLYPSWRDELLAWVCYRSALISACKTTYIVLMHFSQSKD